MLRMLKTKTSLCEFDVVACRGVLHTSPLSRRLGDAIARSINRVDFMRGACYSCSAGVPLTRNGITDVMQGGVGCRRSVQSAKMVISNAHCAHAMPFFV